MKLRLIGVLLLAVELQASAAAAYWFVPTRAAAASSAAATSVSSQSDTLVFAPGDDDSTFAEDDETVVPFEDEGSWLRAPFGDPLITDVDQWRSSDEGMRKMTMRFDYNRVDLVRLGLGYQLQSREVMMPRVGARLEYSFGREEVLYGAQIEQPLLRPGRLALGVSMQSRTDHHELQQVEDFENTLALLFARQDYRDYFGREGFGAYLSWRVPDFSTVSVHVRNDEFRSLPRHPQAGSFFYEDRPLRDNPPIDEGESHAVMLRLERLAHRTRQTRAGFYHWVDLERSGGDLGGDFDYTRLLADLRSVFRLSPATTLFVRMVGGYTPEGTLPAQKLFTLGGVDGLRAHQNSVFRGNQMVLGQAEYVIGLWRIRSGLFEGGLHAIAFADVGKAWTNPEDEWDIRTQKIEADGGFGIAASEDAIRVYFAHNLQSPGSDFVVSLRLQRPF